MWRKLARLRSNVQNIRKSPRVADESMFGGMNGAEFPILVRDMNRTQRWNALSALLRIVLAPFSIPSCFSSQPHVNGADGLWVTGEFAQLSEMNHLMKIYANKFHRIQPPSHYFIRHQSWPLQLRGFHDNKVDK
ncbi:hypothetical protein POTOM_048669 [Populus tomentosa]|uniref:Uncharacterized protein n=1 Tax=Populus tomentosa TaxID=118781 RepID=A0A8X7YDJ7_POPTO|nr:hypothetical protein POTOM_048669 [Populus tomentosa]